MSRRRYGWAVFAAAMWLGAPCGTTAQQPPSRTTPEQRELDQISEEALIQKLDSLLPLLDEAEVRANEVRAATARVARTSSLENTDTFSVGPLKVITPRDQRAVAEVVFRDVWEKGYASFLSASPSLDTTSFTFTWQLATNPIFVDGAVRRIDIASYRKAAYAREVVRHAIGTLLAQDLPPALAKWSGGPISDAADPTTIYRELATAPSQATRNCLNQRPEACWTALGADLQTDDYPLDDWYTPEERRALVAGVDFWWRKDSGLREACVNLQRIEACDTALRNQGYSGRWAPLARATSRNALLWIALNEGGEGAWERLTDPSLLPGDALRFASGLNTEQLSSKWLAWVSANRTPPPDGFDPTLLVSVLWIAAFTALAMRSKRCRLA